MVDAGFGSTHGGGRAGRVQGYPANLEPFPASPEDWLPDRATASLVDLHRATVAAAQDRIDWYDRKGSRQGAIARALRFFALLLVGLGALVPVTAPVLPLIAGVDVAYAGYVVITLAGLLVGLDNFFGFSESWMRFRMTQAELVRRLASFRYEWASRLAADNIVEDRSALHGLLDLQRRFMDSVEAAVEAETVQWATRQRFNLLSFDRKQGFARPDGAPGRVSVRIQGWAALPEATRKALALHVGRQALVPDAGGTAVSPPLDPGSHTVRAEWPGQDGATRSDLKTVTVESDKTVAVDLAVPAEG